MTVARTFGGFALSILLGSLSAPGVLAAARDSANDFARGRMIEPAAAGPLERVVIPRDVYEWTTRTDLGDVRVLNAAGEELPYTLREPVTVQAPGDWQRLPLFALPLPEDDPAGHGTRIELAPDGAIVAVHGGPARTAPRPAWLVDVHGLEQQALELEFTLTPAAGDLVARIRIEASADLERWRQVGETGVLARLAAAGESVLRNLVTLPAPGARYLRITRLDDTATLPLEAVVGRNRANAPPAADFIRLAGKPVRNGWEFDTGGTFPVDRIRVALDQERYLVSARVASRADASARWQDRATQRFHRAVVNGIEALGEPAAVPRTTDRLWRVEWTDITPAEPILEIGWTPRELLFLKQGDPPFMLVYGRGGLAGHPWPITELLRQLGTTADPDTLAPAGLAAPIPLGGPDRLAGPPAERNWSTMLLWSLLVLGAALIIALAVRLAR